MVAAPALPGTRLGERTRAGCFSCQLSSNINKKVDEPHRGCTYGRMAYADCRRDCQITKTIYINNVALSSNINFATSENKKATSKIASRCTSINRNVRKGHSPLTWVGLYFRGSHHRFARRLPPKTAPQCRPKGSLSLTRMKKKCQTAFLSFFAIFKCYFRDMCVKAILTIRRSKPIF